MEHPWALSELLSLSLQAETWHKQLHSIELTQQGNENSYLLHEQEGRFVWRQLLHLDIQIFTPLEKRHSHSRQM